MSTLKYLSSYYLLPSYLQIAQVKKRIEEELELGPAAFQKLIYQGVILKDDATVAAAELSSSNFVVVMVSKAKQPKTGVGNGNQTTSSQTKPTSSDGKKKQNQPIKKKGEQESKQPSTKLVTPADFIASTRLLIKAERDEEVQEEQQYKAHRNEKVVVTSCQYSK